jgi:hypothetical protein
MEVDVSHLYPSIESCRKCFKRENVSDVRKLSDPVYGTAHVPHFS